MALRAAKRVSSATSCCKTLNKEDEVNPAVPQLDPAMPHGNEAPLFKLLALAINSAMRLLLTLFMVPLLDEDEGPAAERIEG